MRHDLLRLFDLYSKFDKSLLLNRDIANQFQVPDMKCGPSVVNRTLLFKLEGQKLLSTNSKYIGSNSILSNGRHIFKSLNDQEAYKRQLYVDSLNKKDLIHQITYEVYDPLSGGAHLIWGTPTVTFNATLNGWKLNSWKDLLSLKQLKPGIDKGNKWLETVLWPAYKRAFLNRYEGISGNCSHLSNCLVKMTTLSSTDGGITTVYSIIYALVRVGFYTTVWYKFMPWNMDIHPNELYFMAWDHFLDESAIVHGYTKITLQETKDLSDIVMSIWGETPFPLNDINSNTSKEMGIPIEDVQLPDEIPIVIDNIDRKWRAGVSLGVIICFCVALGIFHE